MNKKTEIAKEINTIPLAINPLTDLEILLPNKPKIKKPMKGKIGISETKFVIIVLIDLLYLSSLISYYHLSLFRASISVVRIFL